MSTPLVEDLSQAPSETENDRRTGGSHAGDLVQATSGTNRQSCQGVLKATKACIAAQGGHFKHSQ